MGHPKFNPESDTGCPEGFWANPTQDVKTMRQLDVDYEGSITRQVFRMMLKKELKTFLDNMIMNHNLSPFKCIQPHEAMEQMELLYKWLPKKDEVLKEKDVVSPLDLIKGKPTIADLIGGKSFSKVEDPKSSLDTAPPKEHATKMN